MLFKRFLFWSSSGPADQLSVTIYAILKLGILKNIHVKLYEIWISGSGDFVQRKSLRPMEEGRRMKTYHNTSP